jgi:peptidoglycan/xylan/chitin deacetylase (PgdA/CDA1 family)
MNVYTDPAMLANVVAGVQSEKTTYQPETLYALLNDTDSLYTYPVAVDDVLGDLATAIYPGHITSDEQFYDLVYNYYIGTPDIDNWRFMPGFTAGEVARIDKGGRAFSKVNQGRVAYLTFDDWGSDIAITELLDVLDKYDVKATFFIRTNYVESNPNLLRAIAAAGHDIGSHTDQHYALSNTTDRAKLYASLTDEQLTELQQDVLTSWNKLVSVVGDVSYDGSPVLQKMFRPPTLAVSKGGINVVFDLGFDYIVCGSYPSPDYNISSARALYVRLERNLNKGAILIMHMLDSADNTAKAIDLLLAANSRLPKDEQYVFLKLSDSLDGTYTNTNRGN